MDLQFVINMLIVLSVGCINGGNSEIYFIRSPSTGPCPTYLCHTLDHFTRIPKRLHAHNTVILRFLPGVHTLYSDYKLGYPEYFEMSSYNSIASDNPVAIISCKNHSRFNLYRIPHVVIHGLNFQGCGGNKFSKVRYLQIYNSKFVDNHGAALEVNRSSSAKIQHVLFQDNSALYCKDTDPQCCFVGGAVRILTSNISIDSSVFVNNTAFSGGAIFKYGWGNINISNSTFEDNKAACSNKTCEYGVCRSTEYLRNWSKVKGLQMHGGAVTAYGGNNLMIVNSTFTKSEAGTSGGAVYIIWAQAHINHCNFSNNVAIKWGGALRFLFNKTTVINSHFINNSAITGGALDAWRNVTLTVKNSTFSDNKAETAWSSSVGK